LSTLAAVAACTFLLYWWLVAKIDAQQLFAGALIGLAISAPLAYVASTADLRFAFQWSWLGLLLRRLPSKIVRDLALVVQALWRAVARRTGVTGSYRSIPFNKGDADPASAVRRALVMAGISLPPNSFAVDLKEQGGLIIHQLIYKAEPQRSDWPI
jgi:hypothetical protein